MNTFYENPFVERSLSFDFGKTSGATRYEKWENHTAPDGFQHFGKKAIDFIFASKKDSKILFTEIKDFMVISQEGEFKKGDYSIPLAEQTAKKIIDSFEGFSKILIESKNKEEQDFVLSTKTFEKIAVFHWEFYPDFPLQKRMHDMKTMKAKLRELLEGICSNIRIESIDINPSEYWQVTRSGDDAS